MTIFINDKKVTDKVATRFISEADGLVKQIVRAWHESEIEHRFRDKEFKRAVRRNRKTLEAPDTIKTLFTPENYLFSTEAQGRKETLYFKDQAAKPKQTGRLRQQHRSKGPLAKIDKRAKIHRFLSKERFKFLKKWRECHKSCHPCFYVWEERLRRGKYHIEFAYDGKEVSGWHASGGTVKRDKQELDRRIASALENILRYRSKKKSRNEIAVF